MHEIGRFLQEKLIKKMPKKKKDEIIAPKMLHLATVDSKYSGQAR